MRYLIDGNNLLHTIGQSGLAPTPGRESLAKTIARWARNSGSQVTLYFDGAAPRGDLARQIEQTEIIVRFSGGQTADALIEADVAQAKLPTQITVVTTDRAIQHQVRYRKAVTIDSEAFAKSLYEPLQEDPAPPHPTVEKPQQVDAQEVDDWLQRFEEDDDELPSRY